MKFCIFVISLFLGSELIASATPKIEIQGHRGARALRPENTIAAFQYALENKIEVLEMDLSYTKDHVLVLNHDPVINPILCLDPQGKKITNKLFIHEMNVSEVQKYDCGTLVNPRFTKQVPSPKEKIPTFEEVLKLVNDFEKQNKVKIKLNVEIKVHNDFITKNSKKMIKQFLDLIKKYNIYERTILQSFDIRIIDEARQMDSKLITSFLVEERFDRVVMLLNGQSMADLAKRYKFNILSPHHKLITKGIVKELQAQGIEVVPWTANEIKDWQALIDMEVDGIITDNPVGLKDYLNKKTAH